MITFSEVKTEKQITELSILASKIWNEHYPSIIGQVQVDYMLAKMYNIDAIKEQITQGQKYIAAYDGNEMLGFLSYSVKDDKDYFIHKWYVDVSKHSKGIGRGLFDFVFKNKDYKTIRLTVNRHNIQPINFYFKMGFKIEKIINIDIGEGFVMNDFMMLKEK
jgi:ribosomal protein S18 acetylase RimI-like enzyme